MQRTIRTQLQKWFQSPDRKPLILKGARQVGKTFAINQFGRQTIKLFHLK